MAYSGINLESFLQLPYFFTSLYYKQPVFSAAPLILKNSLFMDTKRLQ